MNRPSSSENVGLSTLTNFEMKESLHSLQKMKKGSGSMIMKEIDAIFTKPCLPNEKILLLQQLIHEKSEKLNHIHGVAIMHRCAKNNILITNIIPISTILILFSGPNYRREWKSNEINQALYGLKTLSIETDNITQYINFIIDKIKNCIDDFTAIELAGSLFGLQKFTGDSISVRNLIIELTKIMNASSIELGDHEICKLIY